MVENHSEDKLSHAVRFGVVAVGKGYITLDQLIEAATKQINDNVLNKQHKFIGEILLEKGWITKEEIEIVLNKLSENK